MQITNEILLSFIHCPYKAYRKSKSESGVITDFEKLSKELSKSQKKIFSEVAFSEKRVIRTQSSESNFTFTKGIIIGQKLSNINTEVVLDGIEFIGKNKIVPILFTPFEKVTKIDKLFVSIQASYLQNEFHFQIDQCKIVYGQNLKHTKFRLTSFSKAIKKTNGELNKILIQLNPPVFHRNPHCQICEFQNDCLSKLKERDDLSLLAGLKPKEISQKNNRGLFSVKQLSYTFRPKKNPYRKRKYLPELKALAIREEKTFIQEIPDFKKVATEVFLDFEGIIDRGSNYLIGVILKVDNTETEYSFWADDFAAEESIFIKLIELLESLDDFIVYHYGSYEIQILHRISKKIPQKYKVGLDKIIENSYNLLNIFTHNVYPPTYSNSLKEIARFLKFEWSEKDASGLQSTVWRYNWEISRDNDLKRKLLQYNIEDCKALNVVKKWLEGIDKGLDSKQLTSNLKAENIYKWGVTNYIVKDFEEINSRAYFNYQREHIYLRTEKKVFHAIKSLKSNSKLYNIPDKRINLFPEVCPYCKGSNFRKLRCSEKLQVDLVFMKQGIKKFATLFTGGALVCKNCKKMIETQDMRKTSHYGDNLMLWTVNQKIQYNQSTNQIINILKDSFKIQASTTRIMHFKELIAQKYVPTYKEIVSRINKSNLIHVDETIARIKQIDGYVWVFANYECVYYEFRETREPDFLKDLLSDFNGVLISDFYTGYDGIECEQQKCLVHLIRDLNEDFLKNQFDTELKKIVVEFGILLRKIIATVDTCGLRKIHLNKHKKDVDKFYSNVISTKFESEFALSYQKRFTKYKDKLFLFLEKDNIPWNNNNAEYSIKPFAKWRKKISKCLTKQNIENHLILLSILQTCKYQGINFFEFLKSGEMSIFEFSKK
jgi:predicted RecB family nuclease